jgi:RecB family endonuclease NucS
VELPEAKQAIDRAIDAQQTLVIVGDCSVKYHGRAASKIADGERLVIIKSDRSMLVHQNKNMAAINYQPPRGEITTALDGHGLAVRSSRDKPRELLEVIFKKVFFAQAFALRDDNSLRVFGTEKNLADLLMQDLDKVEPGLAALKQESPHISGSIDIFARDSKGRNVIIEVKRRTAGLKEVSQLKRYVEEVSQRLDRKARGILVAPKITPHALSVLEKQGLEFAALDFEVSNPSAKIRGVKPKQKALGEFLA